MTYSKGWEGLDGRVSVNEELYLERSIERVTMPAS